MHDVPYTTPEEDPFRVQPLRCSSLLNKWIEEQQNQPTPATLDGYDLLDDDDIPQTTSCEPDVPSTPSNPRVSRRASKLTPSSFRNPFRSASPVTTIPLEGSSPRLSRFSFLPRSPRNSTDSTSPDATHKRHNRSSSLSTLNAFSSELPTVTPPRWRPSVLDHFSLSQTSVIPCDTVFDQSRPSVSSADTCASASPTTVETDFIQTPSNLTLMDPTRSSSSVFKSKAGFASSSSVWSQKRVTASGQSSPALLKAGPFSTSTSVLSQKSLRSRLPLAMKSTAQLPNLPIVQVDEDDLDDDDDDSAHSDGQAPKECRPNRPQVAYSAGGTLTRVGFASLSSRQRKKKKLVISGIGFNESKKFDGVKRWCESFGEVSQIVRMPNGDLHVHFRLAEVADTVCRLRAKVFIAGVGSVQLSWFVGDKR